jgi:hypothetical protein
MIFLPSRESVAVPAAVKVVAFMASWLAGQFRMLLVMIIETPSSGFHNVTVATFEAVIGYISG